LIILRTLPNHCKNRIELFHWKVLMLSLLSLLNCGFLRWTGRSLNASGQIRILSWFNGWTIRYWVRMPLKAIDRESNKITAKIPYFSTYVRTIPKSACSACPVLSDWLTYYANLGRMIFLLKESTLIQLESLRCCKSVAIRKIRNGNIGHNGHLNPWKMQKSKQKRTKWTYWTHWTMRLYNHTVASFVMSGSSVG